MLASRAGAQNHIYPLIAEDGAKSMIAAPTKSAATVSQNVLADPEGSDALQRFREKIEIAKKIDSTAFEVSADAILREWLLRSRVSESVDIVQTNFGSLTSTGRSTSHVGELVQGAIRLTGISAGDQDPGLALAAPDAVRCMIDLPAPIFHSTSTVIIKPGSGKVRVSPCSKSKARDAALLFLVVTEIEKLVDVEIDVRSNIPEGRGLGSSSADVRATLVALARVLAPLMQPELIDFLTVISERATNPATAEPSVFCHRVGITAVHLPKFPPMIIVPFDDPQAAEVITNDLRPAPYSLTHINTYELLVRTAVAAITNADARGLATAATKSAELNEQFLPRKGVSTIKALQGIRKATDALGFAVSHSGTVAALLFDRNFARVQTQVDRAYVMLTDLGCTLFQTYAFG